MTWTLDRLVTYPVRRSISRAAAYHGSQKLVDLNLTGGSVTADGRRAIMRDASLTLAHGPLRADLDSDELYNLLLTPGLEIAVERGFLAPDGTEVMAPLGRFLIDEVTYETGDGALNLTCTDVSVRVQRARWTDVYSVASGTSLATALTDLLADRAPMLESMITVEVCPDTVGSLTAFEAGESSDPWQDAVDLAAAHGYTLYCDALGVARVMVVSEPSAGNARFIFERGSRAIVTERTRSSPMSEIQNGVIASGESSDEDPPVSGEAWDENPESLTRRSFYGEVPRFYVSPLLTTTDMCEQAAETMLARILGRTDRLEWKAAVHPGLLPFDVVGDEQEDGTITYHILDCITVPLGRAETMTAIAREVLTGV